MVETLAEAGVRKVSEAEQSDISLENSAVQVLILNHVPKISHLVGRFRMCRITYISTV
jgi:pyridoxal biosynthesis lyase PdxS